MPMIRSYVITLMEELLGTSPSEVLIYEGFVGDKAPDAPSLEEEVATLGVDEVVLKGTTIFHRDEEGAPIIWDYQLKGFFKDTCSILSRTSDDAGKNSRKITAFKKVIDGLVFPFPRRIRLNIPEGKEMGTCQRPIRISDQKGERVALCNSETVPAGTTFEIQIHHMELAPPKAPKKPAAKKGATKAAPAPAPTPVAKTVLADAITEWLDHGKYRGLGQWRNSGKGRFTYETK